MPMRLEMGMATHPAIGTVAIGAATGMAGAKSVTERSRRRNLIPPGVLRNPGRRGCASAAVGLLVIERSHECQILRET